MLFKTPSTFLPLCFFPLHAVTVLTFLPRRLPAGRSAFRAAASGYAVGAGNHPTGA